MTKEYNIIDEIKWSNGFYNEYYLILKSISIKDKIIQYQINFNSKGVKFYCHHCKSNNSSNCNCKNDIWSDGFVFNDTIVKCDYFNNANNIYNTLKDNINDINYLSKKKLCNWLRPVIIKEYNL